MTVSTENAPGRARERSGKRRPGRELVVEAVFGPLANALVRVLLPLRVPPPAVVLANAAAGLLAAFAIARGELVLAALLLQLKTLLDNADGQLARASGRVSALGRYLDTEADLVVNAALFAGLASATGLQGFPTDSFLAFALAVPFIQGALFSTMNAGTDLARDVQTGFINRLSLTALRDWALLTGQLAGVVVLGVVQAVFYLVVGLAAGVEIASGPAGVVVLLVYAAIVSLSFGALGAFLAFRTGSGEAIQALFPLLFVFLFISSMNTPRNLIGVDWFRTAATLNPVSYMIECIRSLIIVGWDPEALILGFGFIAVIGVASLALSSRALRTRMTRT